MKNCICVIYIFIQYLFHFFIRMNTQFNLSKKFFGVRRVKVILIMLTLYGWGGGGAGGG